MLKSEFYDRHELSVPGADDEVIEAAPAPAPGTPASAGSNPPKPGDEPQAAAAKATSSPPLDPRPSTLDPELAAASTSWGASRAALGRPSTLDPELAAALQTHVRPVLERLLLSRIKEGLVNGLSQPRPAVASASGTSEGARKGWETRRGMAGAEQAADRREREQSEGELEDLKARDPGAEAAEKAADEREGGQARTEADEARGLANVKKAIAGKQDVMEAMKHKDLGDIDFRWGREGDASHDYAGGHGFAKIVAKHGEGAALAVPKVIANGELAKGRTRAFIEHEGHRVVLSNNWLGQPTNHWVVSAYEKGENR